VASGGEQRRDVDERDARTVGAAPGANEAQIELGVECQRGEHLLVRGLHQHGVDARAARERRGEHARQGAAYRGAPRAGGLEANPASVREVLVTRGSCSRRCSVRI
jgi:hypothetical protein